MHTTNIGQKSVSCFVGVLFDMAQRIKKISCCMFEEKYKTDVHPMHTPIVDWNWLHFEDNGIT